MLIDNTPFPSNGGPGNIEIDINHEMEFVVDDSSQLYYLNLSCKIEDANFSGDCRRTTSSWADYCGGRRDSLWTSAQKTESRVHRVLGKVDWIFD